MTDSLPDTGWATQRWLDNVYITDMEVVSMDAIQLDIGIQP